MNKKDKKKKKNKPYKQISITIDVNMLELIDKFAQKYNLNRSQAINNLLQVALEDLQIFEKVGLIKVFNFVQDFKVLMKDFAYMCSQKTLFRPKKC